MVNPNLIKLAQEYGSDVCPDVDELFRKPKKKLEGVVGELGKDYGLVFRNHNMDEISVTLDGKTTATIANQKGYHRLFFDGQDLYYTKGNCLYKWPIQPVHVFLGNEAWGITKYKGDIIVALFGGGEIVKSNGEVLGAGFSRTKGIDVFKGELYHVEEGNRNGLVKTLEKRSISRTGEWASGLTVLGDKLYFGGCDKIIYSYDGIRVEEVCNTGFQIWDLHGVRDGNGLIYAGGGGDKKGILVVPLDNPENKKTILEYQVSQPGSIVSAPIDFIKKLTKD